MGKSKKPTTHTDTPPAGEQSPAPADLQYLSTDLIDDPEQPMRSDITPASVEDLVKSIKQMGLIEPLIVKPVNGRFEVIAGHRRLFASKLAKLMELPCIVRQATGDETEMLKIHENLYRQNINPSDEAKHFDYLIQKKGLTPSKISNIIGKSNSYVTDRLAILSYPDFLRQAMIEGHLTFSVAREFSKFDDDKAMRQAIHYAKVSGMTSDMARKWVNQHKEAQNSPYAQKHTPSDDREGAKPVEHTTTCVYCRKPVRMIEAQAVWMHDHCLKQANDVQLSEESEEPDHTPQIPPDTPAED